MNKKFKIPIEIDAEILEFASKNSKKLTFQKEMKFFSKIAAVVIVAAGSLFFFYNTKNQGPKYDINVAEVESSNIFWEQFESDFSTLEKQLVEEKSFIASL